MFDLSTITRDSRGNTVYADPVLAEIAQRRMAYEAHAREVRRALRHLEIRERRRLKALDALGSLTQYPTARQRRFLDVYEQAIATRNAAMIDAAYGICLEGECQKTNWKSKDGEALATHYSRIATELRAEQPVVEPPEEPDNDFDILEWLNENTDGKTQDAT